MHAGLPWDYSRTLYTRHPDDSKRYIITAVDRNMLQCTVRPSLDDALLVPMNVSYTVL